MKNYGYKLISIGLLFTFSLTLKAQTGPAGIGNATGASGQPHNLVWLDASDLSSFAAGNTWTDKSGNLRNAVNTGAPISLGTLNSVKALDFSAFTAGTLAIANHADFDNAGELSIFVVYNSGNDAATAQGLVSKRTSTGGTNTSFSFFQMTAQNLNADDYGARITGSNNSLNTNYIGNYIFQANDSLKIYKNGILDVGRLSGSANLNTIAGAGIQIGKLDASDTRYFKGKIGEIAIFKNNLSPLHRAMVISYLSNKYGITDGDVNIAYQGANAAFYQNLTGYTKTAAGSKDFGPSAGLYLSLNAASTNDYITAAHNGATNDVASIQTGGNVTSSGAAAAWNRAWFIDKNSTATARISFSLPEGITGGQYPKDLANYVLLRKGDPAGNYTQVTTATKGIEGGNRVYFEVSNANFTDGYFTLGTLDQTASPLQGGPNRTWYALATGDWDNPAIWTLDPAGSLPVPLSNTETPAAIDNVVLHTGKTITISADSKSGTSITVNGVLELGTTTGHNFNTINGSGRIRLEGDNFPTGNATHFVTPGQGQGTVVFMGASYNLSTARTFYNVEIELDNNSNTLTLLANYTINGALQINKGTLQLNNNSATTNLNLTVKENVSVSANGQILTGTGNARHQLNLYGNLTNNGTIKFTNRVAANYTAEAIDGIVDANFLHGTRDQTILCNGTTNFYRIEIDKGTDATYMLDITSNNTAFFNLFGYANEGHGSIAQLTTNDNALGLITGTVRIGNNVVINQLSRNSNYNISEGARLWVAGGLVYNNNGNSTVPYGTLEVSSGLMESKVASGITIRDNGTIKISGGTINTNQIRTSVLGATNIGAYIQSGGTVNILGGLTTTTYYVFNLTYPGNVFNMSGGVLHIHEANTKGGVFINSDAVNQNVTGGTVILNIGNANNFLITSKAPFYNLELTKTLVNTAQFILADGLTVGAVPTIDLSAQDLKVLNNFRIRGEETSATYPDITFTAVNSATNVNDVYIGGSLNIEQGATYTARFKVGAIWYDNTTYFNQTIATSAIDSFYYDDPTHGILDLGNFVLNRNHGNQLRLVSSAGRGNANITVDVNGDASVLSGTFDQGRFTFRIWGSITNYDRFGTYFENGTYPIAGGTPSAAQIRFREDPPIIINTTDNAIFGNIRFNVNPTTLVVLNSDVYIERMEFMRGSIYIKNHLLKLDYMWNVADNIFEDITASSTLKLTNSGRSGDNIIYTNGKASDGGLAIKVIQNSLAETQANRRNNLSPITYPIGYTTDGGTTIYFRPAQINVAGFHADSGYVQIRPVSGVLQTSDLTGGEILQNYWRVSLSDFSTPPTNMAYRFYYRNQSGVTGVDLPAAAANEANYVPGFVLDGGAYTRSYESSPSTDVNDVFNSSFATNTRVLVFNGTSNAGEFIQGSGYVGFTPINANYTAGMPNRFVGAPTIYYNRRDATRNWDNNTSWYDTPAGTHSPAGFPAAGNIVVIRGNNFEDAIRVNGTRAAAEIIFQREGTYIDIESIPRLFLSPTDVLNVSKISGIGELYLQQSLTNSATVNADIGEHAANDTSVVIFYMTENGTYNVAASNLFAEFPILRIYGQGAGYNRTASFNYDFKAKQLLVDGQANLLVGGNYTVENRTRLGYTGGGRIIFPNGMNSYRLKTGDFVTGRAKTGSDNNFQLTVQTGGANGKEHVFEVERNIDLNFVGAFDQGICTVDLFSTLNDNNVILSLSGEGNHAFNDNYSPGNSSIDFYKIIMNKGTSNSNTFTLNGNFTLNGPTSGAGIAKAIELQNGTLILNNPSLNLNLTTGNDNFIIPGTAALEVRQGRVNASGSSGIILDGKLIVSGGTVDMSGGDNFIEYSASGNANLTISSGSLTVGSQIRRGLGSTAGILKYNQTGGTVIIGNNTAPISDRGVFEVVNTGSSFTHTGGDLVIVRQQTTPSVAAVYLDPEYSNLGFGSTLQIGNATTPAGQNIGIYSEITLNNLTVNSTNAPTAKMWTVPLSVGGDLTVSSGAGFDAGGLDLNLYGDFINSGTFTANGNTTSLKSDNSQTINGNTIFYNLKNQNPTTVNLNTGNTAITVNNILSLERGTLNDNSNTVTVKGNMVNDATHIYGGAGEGISLNGPSTQILEGDGTFGMLTINNVAGVDVPVGNKLVINNVLKLTSGVFDIGANLLTLNSNCEVQGAPFSASNMIQTNVSFTDNGVRKYFNSGAGSFTFPVGSQKDVSIRFTPVELIITQNTSSTGFITLRPANERHVSIVEDSEGTDPAIVDADNVLQYNWGIISENITGFSGTINFYYNSGDIKVTEPLYTVNNYITAKLLTGADGFWSKIDDNAKVDKINNKLIFDFTNAADADIDGDYTAGVDGSTFNGAIPNQVPLYTSTGSGNWGDAATWNKTAGLPALPRGSRVLIRPGDVITVTADYISAYTTEINGTLNVGNTIGNRVGLVKGTGTLYTESSSLPAGYYEKFFSSTGGTLEYGGIGDYSTLSNIPELFSLKFSGTGKREFPNLDLKIFGTLTIDGPNVINEHNRNISVGGNLIFQSGSYTAKTGKLVFNGSGAQVLSGAATFTGSNAFYNMEMNNTWAGLTIASNVEVSNNLNLIDGLITPSTGTFTITNSSASAISGSSSASYINGALSKVGLGGASGSFVFPVGNSSKYMPIAILSPSGGTTWTAKYVGVNSNISIETGEYGTESISENLTGVSGIDRWTLGCPDPAGTIFGQVKLYWNVNSLVLVPADVRVAKLNTLTNKWHNSGKAGGIVGNTTSGTVTSNTMISFSPQEFTIGAATTAALPVEMLYFEGKSNTDNVELFWATASEENNDYFEVQRSIDAQNFVTIGKVYGAGNSMVQVDYTYMDENPNQGTSYYRLKQVDYDGASEIHKTIAVTWNGTDEYTDSEDITVYPNPFNGGDLILGLQKLEPYTSINLSIMDISGKQIYKASLLVPEDQNVNIVPRAVDGLRQGIYFITVQNTKKVMTKKVIVN